MYNYVSVLFWLTIIKSAIIFSKLKNFYAHYSVNPLHVCLEAKAKYTITI